MEKNMQGMPVVGRGLAFEDLKQGFRFRTHRRTIAESDAAAFVNLTWLTEELFTVEDDASRAIKGRPVPGALVYAFAEGLLLPTMQDTGLAFLNATLDIKGPTVVGDTIHVECGWSSTGSPRRRTAGSCASPTASSTSAARPCSSTTRSGC
jgi:acyl dehydratase